MFNRLFNILVILTFLIGKVAKSVLKSNTIVYRRIILPPRLRNVLAWLEPTCSSEVILLLLERRIRIQISTEHIGQAKLSRKKPTVSSCQSQIILSLRPFGTIPTDDVVAPAPSRTSQNLILSKCSSIIQWCF